MRFRDPPRDGCRKGEGAAMASVDYDSSTENEVPSDALIGPRVAWDPSVRAASLSHGWDAEPLVVDWFGTGEAALLVTYGGTESGRFARVYRPLHEGGDSPRRFDAGQPVSGLDGLRCVCAIPNGAGTRFDLVAVDIDQERLVHLPNLGEPGAPRFEVRNA